MKLKNVLIILFIFSLSNVQSAINFDTSGTGYTVSGNVVTISGGGTYDLENSQTDKNIIISKSCTLNLNSFSLTNSGSLTPILVSASQTLTLVLTGSSTLQDSSTNENEGIIYLESGASLIISGTGTLKLAPNKMMAINGTDSTSLTVNDGATINIQSSSSNAGGVYLRSSITFNNVIYTYSCSSGKNHAIDSEGTVRLIKGKYTITQGSGKGIQSEGYLYIGEENGSDSDLTLTINTSDEGIEAKNIIINSGTMDISAGGDGINAASSGTDCDETVKCSGNCACSLTFKGGSLTLNSEEDGIDVNGDITISGGEIIVFAASNSDNQPIDQDGLLSITGGTILAAGSSSMGGVTASTSQTAKTYTGTINSGAKIVASETRGSQIMSITAPKAANFLYFNHKNDFGITLDGTQLTLTNAGSGQGGQPGPGNPTSTTTPTPTDDDDDDTDTDDDDPVVISTTNGYFLKSLNILIIFGLLLF